MNSDNQNNNRGKGGGGNRRNTTAIISIILWALVLTVLVNYATSMARSANSVEISYGQFRQLVEQDLVESVVMESTKYTITLKDGVVLDEDGNVVQSGTASSDASSSDTAAGDQPGSSLGLPPLESWGTQSTKTDVTYFCAPHHPGQRPG